MFFLPSTHTKDNLDTICEYIRKLDYKKMKKWKETSFIQIFASQKERKKYFYHLIVIIPTSKQIKLFLLLLLFCSVSWLLLFVVFVIVVKILSIDFSFIICVYWNNIVGNLVLHKTTTTTTTTKIGLKKKKFEKK